MQDAQDQLESATKGPCGNGGVSNALLIQCVAFVSVLLSACSPVLDSQASPEPTWIVGEYEGTIRLSEGSGLSAIVREGPVAFSFGPGTYRVRGSGPEMLAPSGCGVYELGPMLMLDDRCAHLAHFDWTLILQGAFTFTQVRDMLLLEQMDLEHGRHRRIELHRIQRIKLYGMDSGGSRDNPSVRRHGDK